MTIELVNTTATLLHCIQNPKATRDLVSQLYSFALMSSQDTDWKIVNLAILDRWTPYALEYIKRLARKRIERAS